MANLKRLRDTENKKIVWAVDKSEHTKVSQVWTNDDGSKLYIYKKDKWVELDQIEEDVKEYGPVWKALDDEMVGYYLTSEPTNLFNWDSGDEVAYTVSIAPNDSDYGAVSESSIDVPYGTPISVDEETGDLTIGTGGSATVVTTTAEEGYTFDSWTDDLGEALPATVTGDLSIVAVFEQEDVPTPPEDFTITLDVVDMPAGTILEIQVPGGEEAEEITTFPHNITIPGGNSIYGSCDADGGLVFDSQDYSQPHQINVVPEDVEATHWTRQSSPYTIDEDGNFSDISSNNTFTITFTYEPEDPEEEPQE